MYYVTNTHKEKGVAYDNTLNTTNIFTCKEGYKIKKN